MIEIDYVALQDVGLTPAVAQRAAGLQDSGRGGRLQRITRVQRDSVTLHDGSDERTARIDAHLGRVLDANGEALTVGDWVAASEDEHGQTWVLLRVPPLTHLARRDPEGRTRPLVSNVDTALLVMGLDADFNARRVERYLALVLGNGVAPLIVLTKADLAGAAACDERSGELRRRLPAHLGIVAVDATHPSSAEALAPWLGRGQTLVLLGSSGTGKSTLTNTLLGSSVQSTQGVRQHDSRGKHTTTSRTLFRLPQGACIIDTPGVRTLRPDVAEAALAASFDDIEALGARCRFRDCRHDGEPGCAVRAGVDADRLANYHKLVRDARRDTASALERQRQVATWKARSRAARAFMKAKGRV